MFYNKIKKVVSVLCLMVFMVNILPSVKVSATPYYSECRDNVSYSLKKNTVGLNIATVKGRISSIGKVTFCKCVRLLHLRKGDIEGMLITVAIAGPATMGPVITGFMTVVGGPAGAAAGTILGLLGAGGLGNLCYLLIQAYTNDQTFYMDLRRNGVFPYIAMGVE